MSQLGTVYATKRRRRNGKSLKPPPKDGVTKSNPSKRHRERLNAELDTLASLLPFEQNILSKLDRLSILRLSVSYLRTKSYFQVVVHKEKEENGMIHIHHSSHDSYRARELGIFENGLLDSDVFLQALNGFLMILTCEGEVFFATHSIESYLGFHQSDIVHQSVYELVHSEDREELQRQLMWNSFLPAELSGLPLAEALAPDKIHHLERSFTVRFRCLLDNTSGFLRLDIRGRVKILHGQNRKTEEPPLALFAYCTPFGPPSLLEIPQKENMFKSKHKLDLSLLSMDQRGKQMLGFSDAELAALGGYDLVHFDDLSYVSSAHQELLKTGASGMIAYRFQKKDGEWQWLQTSSRLVYKNSKPDFVICTHRQLMEEEGRDLLGKRTMDFKVSYLDTGLSSTYFTETEQLLVTPNGTSQSSLNSSTSVTPAAPKNNRRYKTQLRDFLSTCRSKRKAQNVSNLPASSNPATAGTSPTVVDYIPDPAAVAAAYSNLTPMYSSSPVPYGASGAENLYMTQSIHSGSFYPTAENLFHQYRLQSGYYPDYHHHPHHPTSPYVANGFLPYDSYGLTSSAVVNTKEEKWHDDKYYSNSSSSDLTHSTNGRQNFNYDASSQVIQHSHLNKKTPKGSPVDVSSSPSENIIAVSRSNPATPEVLPIQPKLENSPPTSGGRVPYEQSALHRQTVLMWGSGGANQPSNEMPSPVSNTSSPSDSNSKHFNHHHAHNTVPTSLHQQQTQSADKSKSLESSQQQQHHIKWNGNAAINGKEVISIFPIHHHNSEAYSPSNTTNPPTTTHPTIDTHPNHHHFHHRHSSEIPNCEVIAGRNMLQQQQQHNSNMSDVATPTVVYSRMNSVSNSQSQQRQQSTSSLATFTITSTPSNGSNNNGNDQESPLLSFCSVTNTLLNE